MADTVGVPIKKDHSACDGKDCRDISRISVMKKFSYGDTSILNDLVHFNDNDSVHGAKDTFWRALVHELVGSSCFADSHDPEEWSQNNDILWISFCHSTALTCFKKWF